MASFNPLLSEAWFATNGHRRCHENRAYRVLILFLARRGLRPSIMTKQALNHAIVVLILFLARRGLRPHHFQVVVFIGLTTGVAQTSKNVGCSRRSDVTLVQRRLA